MSNLMVRKNGGTQNVPATGAEWPTFRTMRDLLRWDPFQEMLPSWPFESAMAPSFMPAFEVKETKDSYIFKADLPGCKEQDVDITLTGNRLTISGKRDVENRQQNENYHLYERSYGTFSRSFTLPDTADMNRANAEMKDGVLTVTLPKRSEAQPRKLTVGAKPSTNNPGNGGATA